MAGSMFTMRDFYADNKMTFLSFFLMPVLFPLSCLYRIILFIIKFLYRVHILKIYRPKSSVVSVGNVTLGGSGKTPFVAYLADYIGARRPVLVLLRGYKKPNARGFLGSDAFYKFGDEASMLMNSLGHHCQVVADYDRLRQVKLLEAAGFKGVIILDDGFQHWKIERDFDIVVIDVTNPFGNKMVLPAGQLREGLGALERADCICLSRCDEAAPEKLEALNCFLSKKAPSAVFIKTIHQNVALRSLKTGDEIGLEHVKGKRVCLFCGIANPRSFVASVKRLGAQVAVSKFFPDHHEYDKNEAESLIKMCLDQRVSVLVTTDKDAQRLCGFFAHVEAGIDIFVLKIAIKIIEGQEVLYERINSLRGI